MTQSFPTYHHTFHTDIILSPGDSPDRYREVTAAERKRIETADAEAAAAGLGVRTVLTPVFERMGAVFNPATGYYEMNGLTDLTEADMTEIMFAMNNVRNKQVIGVGGNAYPPAFSFGSNRLIRTLPPINILRNGGDNTMKNAFSDCAKLEAVEFKTGYRDLLTYVCGIREVSHMFYICPALRSVKGLVPATNATGCGNMFAGCPKLETLELYELNADLNLSGSPLISAHSLRFICGNRYGVIPQTHSADAPVNPVTITLHPDTYARVTDPEDEEYGPLLELAASHDITFAAA